MTGDIFVGREPELGALQDFLGRAAAGTTQIVFVTGEAGSGKSALVREFVRRTEAADSNVVAAIGECNAQTGAGDAYLPFRQVLTVISGAQDEKETSKAIDATNAERLREFVRVSGETLLDVGPDLVGIFVPGATLFAKLATSVAANTLLGRRLAERMDKAQKGETGPRLNSNLDQEKIFQQYADVVQALAREHTLVLILDDLQWADSASLNLLFHLARQLKESRVLLVGTYRPDDVALGRDGARHPLEPILNELKRYYGDMVIDLGTAQAAEGRAFVDALVDSEPNRLDAAFRNELFARTEGHPLFTVELLRNLQERGDLMQDSDGRWIQSATLDWKALPARVEGVVEERLARLAENLRETLNIASVIGYEFAAQVVARVQQVQEGELLKSLTRELEKRHRLVLEQGETLVGKQFLSQYRFVHALFQQFLYDELGTGERRMMHRAIAAALEQLYGEHADDVAVQLARHYAQAGDDEKTAEYAIRAGDLAARRSANAEARGNYDIALDALSRLSAAADNRRERVDLTLKRISVSLRDEGPYRALEHLAGAEALAGQLVALPTATREDRLRLARTHYWMAQAYLHGGQSREAVQLLQEVVTVANAEGGEDELRAIPESMIGRALMVQGRFDEAESHLRAAATLLDPVATNHEWVMAVGGLGISLAARGDYGAGLVEGERARQGALEANNLTTLGLALDFLSTIYLMGNDVTRWLEASGALLSTAEKAGDSLLIYLGYGLQAWAQSRSGALEAAFESMEQSQRVGRRLGERLAISDWLAAANAELALNAHQTARALELAAQAVALAQSMNDLVGEGMAHRVWAQALAHIVPPRWEQADEHFAASLRVCAEGDARLEAARTHVAWGEVLQTRGDIDAARQHFEQAAAQYEASGLGQQLEEVRRLIAPPRYGQSESENTGVAA